MDRNISEYRKMGGKNTTIADCWGVKKQYISQLVNKHGDDLRVEFADIDHVRRLYLEGREEKVFFEREYS